MLALLLHAQAQDANEIDDELNQIDHSSHIELGLGFASQLLNQGRDMNVKGPIFIPSIVYKNKTGVYSYLKPNIYSDSKIWKQSKFPDIEFCLGYDHVLAELVDLDISYSHDFITYGKPAFRKLFDNSLSLQTEWYLGKIMNVGANAYVLFSRGKNKKAHEKVANAIELYLSKDISFYETLGAKRLSVSPVLLTSLGSDNFALTKKNPDQTTVSTLNSFWGLLDMEASTEFEWRNDRLTFGVIPTYVLPFNLDVTHRNNQAGTGKFILNAELDWILFKQDK
jgi:hypothetical protein